MSLLPWCHGTGVLEWRPSLPLLAKDAMDGYAILQLGGLALFTAVVTARTVTLRRRIRRNPIRLLSSNGSRDLPALLLFVEVNLWVADVLLHLLWSAFRPLPGWAYAPLVAAPGVRLAGAALSLGGLAIFGAALVALGESWRLGIDADRPGRLVTSGIYRHSRHPIYVFFVLYALGAFLMNGNAVALGLALVIAVTAAWQIIREEAFLLATYGDAYRTYAARTGRLVTMPAHLFRRPGERAPVREEP